MFSKQLKKILLLSKQTGDRVIIYDSQNPDDAYIISHLNQVVSDVDLFNPTDSQASLNLENEVIQEGVKQTPEPIQQGFKQTPEPAIVNTAINLDQDLTGEDLTDKINQEILKWKNQEGQEREEVLGISEEKVNNLSEEFTYSSAQIDATNIPYNGRQANWKIPSEVKDKAHDIE